MNLFSSDIWREFFGPGQKSDLTAPNTCMLALEPRIMYDAAGIATALDDTGNDGQTPDNALADIPPSDTFQEEVALIQDLFRDYTPPSTTTPKEIIFIDTTVADYEQLVQNVSTTARVIVLDQETNPLTRITNELTQHKNLDAIHIVSHGGPGSLQFGNGVLDLATLQDHAKEFQAWEASLSSEADILVYGCDVAAGDAGKAFVNKLSELTGADVAASIDKTGAADMGGDWDLEIKSGAIETVMPGPFLGYQGVLDTVSLTNTGQSLGSSQSEGVSLGDLDNDGDLDAFVTNSSGQANKVYLNDGSGNYTDSGQNLGSSWSQEVVLADLDNDGDLDAFVANAGDADKVWLNNGSGTFTDSGQSLSTGSARAVAMADFDKDGDLDAFIGAYGANEVWFNNGSGVFSVSQASIGTGSTQDISLGDIDGDGDIDAFEANWGSEANMVWVNDGSGIFTSSGQSLGSSVSMGVSLTDVDNDGDLDAFVANLDGNPDKVWINDGSGTFSDSGQNIGTNASYGVTMTDIDRDGDQDALVVGGRVWLNDGSGTFIDSGIGYSGREAAIGDLDSDGDLDAFLATGGACQVWRNDAAPWSITSVDSGQSLGSTDAGKIAYGDLDGDGDLDAFVANGQEGGSPGPEYANKIWLNDGSGIFTDSGQSLGTSYGTSVALGDVDGDGDLDAIVTNRLGQANKLWINNGSASFTDSGQTLGASGQDIALGDVDKDGDLDAYIAVWGSNQLWLNNGSGTFSDSGQSLGGASYGVSLADVDSDGDLDAFIANGGANTIWLNNGYGTFSDSGQSLGSSASNRVRLFDLDNDGDIDAFVANYSNNANKVWFNNGAGVFTDSGQNLGSSDSNDVALADLDADGDLDAYVANYAQGNKIWLNNGAGSFSDSGLSLGTGGSRGVALFDVNSDGDLDAFIVNQEESDKVYFTDRAPLITAGASLFYTENDTASIIDNTIAINDADDVNIESATVTISANYIEGEDILSFTNTGSITGSWNASTAILTLTGSDTLANYQTALRSITYQNIDNSPSILSRTITFKVNDGDIDSAAATSTVNVEAVNDAPAITGGAIQNYTENGPPTVIDNTVTLTDPDDTNLEGATITIFGNYVEDEDILHFTNQNGITSSWNASTATLTLTGTDTVANYQAALRSVAFETISESPSELSRSVSFKVNDGNVNSNVAFSTIHVTRTNDLPMLDLPSALNLTYTEGVGAISLVPEITVNDADDINMESASIRIAGNYKSGEDVLQFTNVNGITGTWDAATGTLNLAGDASEEVYQEALRSISYVNLAGEYPTSGDRTILFSVNDGEDNSAAISITLSIQDIPEPPPPTSESQTTSSPTDTLPVDETNPLFAPGGDDFGFVSDDISVMDLLPIEPFRADEPVIFDPEAPLVEGEQPLATEGEELMEEEGEEEESTEEEPEEELEEEAIAAAPQAEVIAAPVKQQAKETKPAGAEALTRQLAEESMRQEAERAEIMKILDDAFQFLQCK